MDGGGGWTQLILGALAALILAVIGALHFVWWAAAGPTPWWRDALALAGGLWAALVLFVVLWIKWGR